MALISAATKRAIGQISTVLIQAFLPRCTNKTIWTSALQELSSITCINSIILTKSTKGDIVAEMAEFTVSHIHVSIYQLHHINIYPKAANVTK